MSLRLGVAVSRARFRSTEIRQNAIRDDFKLWYNYICGPISWFSPSQIILASEITAWSCVYLRKTKHKPGT